MVKEAGYGQQMLGKLSVIGVESARENRLRVRDGRRGRGVDLEQAEKGFARHCPMFP